MSMLTAPRPAVKPRVLFSALDRHPAPRRFGLGLAPARPIKTAGYTAADAQWWAEFCADATTAPTEAEAREEFELRTMSAREYRDLCMDLEEMERDSFARWVEEREADYAAECRMESLPAQHAQCASSAPAQLDESSTSAPTHHILSGEGDATLGILLEGVSPRDLDHAAERARMVQAERCSTLRHAAWIARDGEGNLFMLDRCMTSDRLVFTGSMKIHASVLTAAFGCTLPG